MMIMKKSIQLIDVFGKKLDNEYRIIERKFKDNNVLFFVQVTNTFDFDYSFGINLFPEKRLLEESFKTFEAALTCVNELKEEDRKRTVLEEKIHEV